jgi:hypothetical protein
MSTTRRHIKDIIENARTMYIIEKAFAIRAPFRIDEIQDQLEHFLTVKTNEYKGVRDLLDENKSLRDDIFTEAVERLEHEWSLFNSWWIENQAQCLQGIVGEKRILNLAKITELKTFIEEQMTAYDNRPEAKPVTKTIPSQAAALINTFNPPYAALRVDSDIPETTSGVVVKHSPM